MPQTLPIDRFVVFLLASFVALPLAVCAQQRTAKAKAPRKKDRIMIVSEGLPQIKDFAFVISIGRDGRSTVTVQKIESSASISNAHLSEYFRKLFAGQNTTKAGGSPRLEPIVVIEPDQSLDMGAVIAAIDSVRPYNSRIKVRFGAGKYFWVPPPRPAGRIELRPDPLRLVVNLDDEGKLTLNNEAAGSTTDPEPLTKWLREIFKARADNGVLRLDSNTVETTVFIKAPPSAKFHEVAKLAGIIAEAGSTLLGLKLDDIEPMIVIEDKLTVVQ